MSVLRSRWIDRLWKVVPIVCAVLLLLVVLYDHARFDDLLAGKVSIQGVEINRTGETVQQVLAQGQAESRQLQAALAQLHATDASQQAAINELQQEIAALHAELVAQATAPAPGPAPAPAAVSATSPPASPATGAPSPAHHGRCPRC